MSSVLQKNTMSQLNPQPKRVNLLKNLNKYAQTKHKQWQSHDTVQMLKKKSTEACYNRKTLMSRKNVNYTSHLAL